MNSKIWVIIFLLLICLNLVAESNLGMFIDVKRYLDANKSTRFVIDYQIPYKNLMFKQRGNVYYAELMVNIQIAYPDSERYIPIKEFTNNIGVSRKYDLSSGGKSYLDRITLTPPSNGYKLRIQFEDSFSEKAYIWKYTTENLQPDTMLSDLEIVREISPDTTLYSKKFTKNNKTYVPEISGLITKGSIDSLHFFGEYYNNFSNNSKAVLSIVKDSVTVLIANLYQEQFLTAKQLLFPVNISNFEAGRYTASIEFTSGLNKTKKDVTFILTEQSEEQHFLFSDPDEEYLFIRSISTVKSQTDWKSFSREAKRRYVTNFWLVLAANQNQQVSSVMDLYKQRIDYSNTMFSHFEKGWKSDMGRIYIRNGPADETDNDTSSDDTKFVRKDYQIWKYTSGSHPVYVFVDIPMNGNFKLVYAENDPQESTNPNWKNYLGKDFDELRLEN